MDNLQTAKLVDKDGDIIDLAVILGAYKSQTGVTSFFERFTNYSAEEREEIIKYAFTEVTPNNYNKSKAAEMRNQIEAAFGVVHFSLAKERDLMLMFSWIISLLFCCYAIFKTVSFNWGGVDSLGNLFSAVGVTLLFVPLLLSSIGTIFAFIGWLKYIRWCALVSTIFLVLAALGALSMASWVLLAAAILSGIGYSNLKKQ